MTDRVGQRRRLRQMCRRIQRYDRHHHLPRAPDACRVHMRAQAGDHVVLRRCKSNANEGVAVRADRRNRLVRTRLEGRGLEQECRWDVVWAGGRSTGLPVVGATRGSEWHRKPMRRMITFSHSREATASIDSIVDAASTTYADGNVTGVPTAPLLEVATSRTPWQRAARARSRRASTDPRASRSIGARSSGDGVPRAMRARGGSISVLPSSHVFVGSSSVNRASVGCSSKVVSGFTRGGSGFGGTGGGGSAVAEREAPRRVHAQPRSSSPTRRRRRRA